MDETEAVPVTMNSFQEAMESVSPTQEVKEKIEINEDTDLTTEDEKLFSLSKHPGWEIMASRMRDDIARIEASSGVRQGETMDVYGARRAAGDEVIKYIKGYLTHIESIVAYAKGEGK